MADHEVTGIYGSLRESRSHAIPELPLSGGRLYDLQNDIGDFLWIGPRASNFGFQVFGNLRHFTVSGLSAGVFSFFDLSMIGVAYAPGSTTTESIPNEASS